jgi:hypothetical protein
LEQHKTDVTIKVEPQSLNHRMSYTDGLPASLVSNACGNDAANHPPGFLISANPTLQTGAAFIEAYSSICYHFLFPSTGAFCQAPLFVAFSVLVTPDTVHQKNCESFENWWTTARSISCQQHIRTSSPLMQHVAVDL